MPLESIEIKKLVSIEIQKLAFYLFYLYLYICIIIFSMCIYCISFCNI